MYNSVMHKILGVILVGLAAVASEVAVAADEVRLKPFILGTAPGGNREQAVTTVKAALRAQGFEEAGSYSPYAGATVIVVTSPELKTAAASAKHGGFGAGQRVAVTDYKGKLQVSYMNPAYIGAAYGLGKLETVSGKLKAALGATKEFGAVDGLTAEALAPGTYHYMVGMPYFHQVDVHAKHPDYQTALAAVEKGLAAGKGGTKKVYRIDLPGQQISVFGVGDCHRRRHRQRRQGHRQGDHGHPRLAGVAHHRGVAVRASGAGRRGHVAARPLPHCAAFTGHQNGRCARFYQDHECAGRYQDRAQRRGGRRQGNKMTRRTQ